MKRDLVMGYAATCYGMRRVSHALPLTPHHVAYRQAHRIPWHRLPLAPSYWINQYDFVTRPNVDAMHLFNGICMKKRVPWVSSIEVEFPRYFGRVPKQAFEEAARRIAADDCRLLLPLSDAARRHFLSRIDGSVRDTVARKTHVFTGGVAIPSAALAARARRVEAPRGGPFVVGFVGKAYWHKGGPALVDAIRQLRAQSTDVRLLLVSAFENTHLLPHNYDEIQRTRAEVASVPWIEWHERLPNTDLLIKMAGCDVLAFPTLDESLGWVAIEAAGLGLPVVSSNVFALPELVEHEVNGLTIDLPVNDDGRWCGIKDLNPSPHPSYEEASTTLTHGLIASLGRMLNDSQLIDRLGRTARARFLERYEETRAAARLAGLLKGALG